MRVSSSAAVIAVIAVVGSILVGGCGEAASATPPVTPGSLPTSTTATSAATLEKSPDSGQVDRVGPDDGGLRPDGVKDLSFVTQVEGPIAAVLLVSVDDQGKPTGHYQADTLIGDQPSPAEVGERKGGTTSGIGVYEADKLLNGPDGTLGPVAAGAHKLTLYVAASATLKPGTKLRVYLQRPDKSVISGGTVTN